MSPWWWRSLIWLLTLGRAGAPMWRVEIPEIPDTFPKPAWITTNPANAPQGGSGLPVPPAGFRGDVFPGPDPGPETRLISPTFRELRDGRVLVDLFPGTAAISREVLECAHPALLHRRWRTVTFRCANATGVYRMVRRDRRYRTYTLVRLVRS